MNPVMIPVFMAVGFMLLMGYGIFVKPTGE